MSRYVPRSLVLTDEMKYLLLIFEAAFNMADHSLLLTTLSSLGFRVTLSWISFCSAASPSPSLLLASQHLHLDDSQLRKRDEGVQHRAADPEQNRDWNPGMERTFSSLHTCSLPSRNSVQHLVTLKTKTHCRYLELWKDVKVRV